VFKSRVAAACVGIMSASILCFAGSSVANAEPQTDSGIELIVLPNSTVDEMLRSAIDAQGNEVVSEVLAALADSSAAGTTVNFPGLEGLDPQTVAADLSAVSDATKNGDSLPADIASLPVGDQTSFESDSFARAAVPGTQVGEAVNNNRSWLVNTKVEGQYCDALFCSVTDRKDVTITFDPGNTATKVTVSTLYALNGRALIGNVSTTVTPYRNVSVAGGGTIVNVGSTTTSQFVQHSAPFKSNAFIYTFQLSAPIRGGSPAVSPLLRTNYGTCSGASLPTCVFSPPSDS